MSNRCDIVERLACIKYVGEKRALLMHHELGVETLEQMIAAAQSQQLETLDGIGVATQERILEAALAYVCDDEDEVFVSKAQDTEQGQEDALFAMLLKCPVCGHESLYEYAHALVCTACQRAYGFKGRVADMMPPEQGQGISIFEHLCQIQRHAALLCSSWMESRVTHDVKQRTLNLLDIPDGARMLTVGWGGSSPSWVRLFASHMWGGHVVGVDTSMEALLKIRRVISSRGGRVSLVRGEPARLPVRPASFDRVHSAYVLHQINDVDATLRHMARALKPGCVGVVSIFMQGRGLLGEVERSLGHMIGIQWFGINALRKYLRRTGFEILVESVVEEVLMIKMRRLL